MWKYVWQVMVLGMLELLLYAVSGGHPVSMLAMGGAGLLLLPVANRCIQRIHKAETEFFEMTSYMEQLLCSYKRWGILPPALEDCIALYPEKSRMGCALRRSLYILKTGEGVRDDNITERALSEIQQMYPSRRLQLMHEFLCGAEKMGGDREESLDILLCDLQMWKRRIHLYQKKKQFIRRENLLAVVLAFVLCGLSTFLIPRNMRNMLKNSAVFQISTTVVTILLLLTTTVLMYHLTGTWLDIWRTPSDKDQKREKRNYHLVKSNRGGISGYLAKRVCQKEVEREFSYWLLSVTLYLQGESVYQAAGLAQKQAKGIFAEETAALREAIYENPVSLQPYLSFFAELNMPEIQTGMKLLYAFGSNNYQDISRQIRFLVEQNNIVMDQYERRHLEEQIAGMGLLRQIPMVLACVKVILDMVILLLLTMGDILVL